MNLQRVEDSKMSKFARDIFSFFNSKDHFFLSRLVESFLFSERAYVEQREVNERRRIFKKREGEGRRVSSIV